MIFCILAIKSGKMVTIRNDVYFRKQRWLVLHKNLVVIENLQNFDLGQTLQCGQIFRYEKISEHSYFVIAKNKRIKLTQQPQSTTLSIYNSTLAEYEEIWKHYLDIETDYKHIIDTISKNDSHMKNATEYGKGIRILNQDPWEMIISFIISQNKAIPHIQQCIQNLCEAFGELIIDEDQSTYYAFPTPEALAQASEEELRACKVGFRAPYIMDACRKVLDNTVPIKDIYHMTTAQAKESLMKIKGVGEKVSHCVLLFGFNKTDTFPTDVWIKRIMQELYFNNEETKNIEIINFANQKFGEYAGYAQQYLFYYARENNK